MNSTPRICQFNGCDRRHYANGWCRMHYRRVRQQETHVMDDIEQATDGPHEKLTVERCDHSDWSTIYDRKWHCATAYLCLRCGAVKARNDW